MVAFDWDEIIDDNMDWFSSDEESDSENSILTVCFLIWEQSLDSLWIGSKRGSLWKEPAVTVVTLLGNFYGDTIFSP